MKKYIPRLKEKYFNEVVPRLKEDLGYENIMQVPKLNKICINQGVGQAVNDKKLIELASEEMTKITGQKSVVALSTYETCALVSVDLTAIPVLLVPPWTSKATAGLVVPIPTFWLLSIVNAVVPAVIKTSVSAPVLLIPVFASSTNP